MHQRPPSPASQAVPPHAGGHDLALPHTNPPARDIIEPIVRAALAEDLGNRGDITTDNTIPADKRASGVIVAREAGVICGLVTAEPVFAFIDERVRLTVHAPDGSRVNKGDIIAEIEGPARALLTGERNVLNFMGHLSGIATATHAMVERVAGTKARILDTRKTTPGLRLLEKYAVRCGGGTNHRVGLFDAVLIKDNHIAAAGGITQAIEMVRARLNDGTKIEVEVESLAQLEIALSLGVDNILLDNMKPDMLRRAVEITNGRAALEASGNVTLDTVRPIAETGVDYISSGALTHSARNLDVALDFA